jgi:hypothetical protein
VRLARRITRLEGGGCSVCRTWTGQRLVGRFAAAIAPHIRDDDKETDWAEMRKAIDEALHCSACQRRFSVPLTALRACLHGTP